MKVRIMIEKEDNEMLAKDVVDAVRISGHLMDEYDFNVEDIVIEKRRYVIKLSRGKHE